MAVFDDVLLANMALNIIGIGQEIEDLAATTALARTCNRWLPVVLEDVLSDFEWGFATIRAPLELVEAFTDATDPDIEWAYSYGRPNTCIVARRIVSGERPDSAPIPFECGQGMDGDNTTRLIFTDQPDAILEMTATYGDSGKYSSAFAQAVAGKLAVKIAGPLRVAADKKALGMEEFAQAIIKAKGLSNTERRLAAQPVSSYVAARGPFRDPRFWNRRQ